MKLKVSQFYGKIPLTLAADGFHFTEKFEVLLFIPIGVSNI